MNPGGGSVMLRGRFSAAGPERLVKVEGEINAVEKNLLQSVGELPLKKCIFQQVTNVIATQEWHQNNNVQSYNSQVRVQSLSQTRIFDST